MFENRWSRWTSHQDRIIRSGYRRKRDILEIAEEIGRTPEAIYVHALIKLGLDPKTVWKYDKPGWAKFREKNRVKVSTKRANLAKKGKDVGKKIGKTVSPKVGEVKKVVGEVIVSRASGRITNSTPDEATLLTKILNQQIEQTRILGEMAAVQKQAFSTLRK